MPATTTRARRAAALAVAAGLCGAAAGATSAPAAVDRIVYTEERHTSAQGTHHLQAWEDPRSGASRTLLYDAAGRLIAEHGLRVRLVDGEQRWEARSVLHRDGTWEQWTSAQGLGAYSPWDRAAELRNHVRTGLLAVTGRQEHGAGSVLTLEPASGSCVKCGRWQVEEDTFRPVTLTYWSTGLGKAPAFRGERRYSYEPRTRSALAALWPQVPAGFDQARAASHRRVWNRSTAIRHGRR